MAANLLARYIWEINELSRSRRGLTSEELNQRWRDCWLYDGKPIIRKTWYEHRQQIAVQFGIDITCDKTTNRYRISNRDDIGKPAIQEWLLNSFAVGNMLLQGKDMKGRILCEDVPSGAEYLADIIQGMREGKIISITYQSFYRDTPSTFPVKPYCVKVFKQRWYLAAASVRFGDVRIYALDRIQDLEITDEKFSLPRDFNAAELFENFYGVVISSEEDPEEVVVKVYNGQADYLRSLPLHHSQREVETNASYSTFAYYLVPTYDFVQELLLHGPDIEVVKPLKLRKLMKKRTAEMAALYGGKARKQKE